MTVTVTVTVTERARQLSGLGTPVTTAAPWPTAGAPMASESKVRVTQAVTVAPT